MVKEAFQKANFKTEMIVDLLAILWIYAAMSKLWDFTKYRKEIYLQVIPSFVKVLVIYGLPTVELIVATGLLIKQFYRPSLYASSALLTAFSIYILLALSGLLGRAPCSCGGILENMTWTTHLFFNLTFIALSAIAIVNLRERRSGVIT